MGGVDSLYTYQKIMFLWMDDQTQNRMKEKLFINLSVPSRALGVHSKMSEMTNVWYSFLKTVQQIVNIGYCFNKHQ